jgi:hypothetical protein
MPPHIPPATERRIRREARSATLRERALALRTAGWTYTAIGNALGFSSTRALQLVRKAERLQAKQKGAPLAERPFDSDDPFTAGQLYEAATCYDPTTS